MDRRGVNWPGRLVLLVLVFLGLACRQKEGTPPYAAWGLPEDLDSYKGQLRSLRLPKAVDRLGWLPAGLESLDASRTAIRSLKGLPRSLRALDVSYTAIESLDSLPASLRALRAVDVRVTDFEDLPHLTALAIGGASLTRLEGLPDSIVDLTLADVKLSSLEGLPPHLESLRWSGSNLTDPEQLPSSLKALQISGSGITNLSGLPRRLESLEVRLFGTDARAELEPLPPFLVSLSLDGSYFPDLSKNRYLRRLNLIRVPVVTTETLPDSLTHLRINSEAVEVDGPLPTSLRTIGQLNYPKIDFSALPRALTAFQAARCKEISGAVPSSLELLDLSWCNLPGPSVVPSTLLFLKINSWPVESIEDLPSSLLSLEAHWTKVVSIHALPPDLRELDLTGSPELRQIVALPAKLASLKVASTGLASLPALPPGLKHLDVSGTQIHTLKDLPSNLEHLVIGAHQIRNLGPLPKSLKALEVVD